LLNLIFFSGDGGNGIHLFARALSSTIVRVSWITTSNSDLTRFLLRYRPVNANSSQPVDVFVKSFVTDYVLNNLQEYTEYAISLIPYFNDMPGNLTLTTIWTFSDVPSAPPKDVNVETNNTVRYLLNSCYHMTFSTGVVVVMIIL
jgi:hypothetical protein